MGFKLKDDIRRFKKLKFLKPNRNVLHQIRSNIWVTYKDSPDTYCQIAENLFMLIDSYFALEFLHAYNGIDAANNVAIYGENMLSFGGIWFHENVALRKKGIRESENTELFMKLFDKYVKKQTTSTPYEFHSIIFLNRIIGTLQADDNIKQRIINLYANKELTFDEKMNYLPELIGRDTH
ncbi:MAG: hypothetical protein EKK64_09810 [Neisseriaceae bacterium]|nr:MAG: hypothetical protein EKK64_09810 [Neisseriaceae bacterium]